MDLTTHYLGLRLRNPVVPSASPFSESIDHICRIDDAGAGALVMHSLFEEQIEHESRALDHYLSYGTHSYAEALTYFPEPVDYHVGPDEYLETIRRAKESVSMPIIGSLNGVSTGGWIDYARLIQQAGADALELNVYFIPTDPTRTGAEIEQVYVDIVREVKKSISIPLAVKIGPFFSAPANMAQQLVDAGAHALVLFNRFYQPDLDIEKLVVSPGLTLSNSYDLRVPLRWIAMLYGRIHTEFAITGGVHTHIDVLKGLMAGANVTMMASELLQRGISRISEVLVEMEHWMEEHEYESVEQMRGSMSQMNVAEPAAFERANYMKILKSWRPDPTGSMMG